MRPAQRTSAGFRRPATLPSLRPRVTLDVTALPRHVQFGWLGFATFA